MKTNVISIRKLGEGLFEIVPPTAADSEAWAALLGEDGAAALRRQLFSTFDEAVGAGVAYASALNWRLHDETGRLSDEQLAEAVKMYPDARKEGRL